MTRNYEIAVVLNPDLSDAELERLGQSIKVLIQKNGGSVTAEDVWGRKSTAYALKGYREAYYIFYNVELPSDKVFPLDQALKHTENVLRYLITIQEENTAEGN